MYSIECVSKKKLCKIHHNHKTCRIFTLTKAVKYASRAPCIVYNNMIQDGWHRKSSAHDVLVYPLARTTTRSQQREQIVLHCQFFLFVAHRILELARMSPLTDEFKEYMINIVRNTIEYREKHGVSRKDFIQLLIELRSTGKVSSDDVWNADTKPDSTPPAAAAATSTTKAPTTTTSNEFKSSLTIEQCAAQVALFYLAGFDTTASAISYCLFELSRQPDLLKRLQREIDDTMTKHNNVITYDCIQEMPFLDLCVRGKCLLVFIYRPLSRSVCVRRRSSFVHSAATLYLFRLSDECIYRPSRRNHSYQYMYSDAWPCATNNTHTCIYNSIFYS